MAGTGHLGSFTTARAAGLVSCHRCGQVHDMEATHCRRCYATLHSRTPDSLQKVWAWWLAGVITFIPANIYPMLLTSTIVERSESTIIGGVFELVHYGSYGIAAVVFVASIVIPLLKFFIIAYLALSVRQQALLSQHQRHQMFVFVEFVGRWSMIDIFVVAILASLVQLDTIAAINPGIAAINFALAVVFTMFSAQSFDARLIWDENGAAAND